MAYGVKFRLDFDDVLGNGKRVEILQDSYTGDVKSLIGTADPVNIEWDGDDDVYSPIIGSTCTVNLFQTDDTDYDDFTQAEEKEYKIIVYAAQTVSDIYKDRVQEDGGFVEAKSCIDSTITGYYDTESYFNKRVLDDGGVTESLDCIGEILTVERRNIYTTFWVGWLVPDNYTELMAPNPQPISIKAIDGIGELDGFFVDSNFYFIFGNSIRASYKDLICKSLDKTDLDLDVLINSDLRYGTAFIPPISLIDYTFTFYQSDIFLDNDYNFFNVKQFLENLLKNFNGRVFQSRGKWVVINNSTYSEQRVIDYVKDYIDDNTSVPTGIGALRETYLKSGIEELYFYRFNSSGTFQDYYPYQGLREIRKNLQPLDRSLFKEAIRGFKSIQINTEPATVNLDFADDVSFEFSNTFHWTVSNGSIVSNEISLSGNKSFKTTAQTSSGNPTTIAITGNYTLKQFEKSKLKLSYYYDSNNTSQTGSLTNVFWCQLYFTTLGSTYYYDYQNQLWTTTVKYIDFDRTNAEAADQWVSESLEISNTPVILGGGSSYTVYLRIYAPNPDMTNYQGVYVDNVALLRDQEVLPTKSVKITQDTTTNVLIEDFDYDRLYIIPTMRYNDLRPTGLNLIEGYKSAIRQQVNDFRKLSVRYEGTLYNLQSDPVSLMDKIRVNFSNLEEPNSFIIDGLKYNVKKNVYEIIAHVPNQDDDVDTTITKQTTTVNYYNQ